MSVDGFHARLAAAGDLLDSDRLDQAERQLQLVIREAPDSGHAHALLAEIARRHDRLSEARSSIAEALRLDPEDEYAHRVHALILSESGLHREAEHAAATAISLAPWSHAGLLVRGQLARKRGNEFAAIVDARTILGRWPGHVEAHRLAALAHTDLGEHESAAVHVAQALSLDPESTRSHATRGEHLRRSGSAGDAVEAYRAALRIDPTNEAARRGLLAAVVERNRGFRFLHAIARSPTRLRYVPLVLVVLISPLVAASWTLREFFLAAILLTRDGRLVVRPAERRLALFVIALTCALPIGIALAVESGALQPALSGLEIAMAAGPVVVATQRKGDHRWALVILAFAIAAFAVVAAAIAAHTGETGVSGANAVIGVLLAGTMPWTVPRIAGKP
jgi:tetratricopeptide (TPR) repeat protein